MNGESPSFERVVRRAAKGEFREYWLQLYIRENYKKLGFNSIQGPFETGYDFKGVYKGQKVVVEAESLSKNFVYHRHNPNEVDILIVLNDDATDEVLGMKPIEWRKRLPNKIIVVDPEHFVQATHEVRKHYAIKKKEELQLLTELLPFFRIRKAFATLWQLLVEEGPYEGTPERQAFEEAAGTASVRYLETYNLDLKKLRKARSFTRIEVLANDLLKSRRGLDALTSEEKEFLVDWLEVLQIEYASRI